MGNWKRSVLSGRYSRGSQSFVVEPHGRAGYIVYNDGTGTYRVPYEYGSPALFHVWPKLIRRENDSNEVLTADKQLEIANRIREAVESIHKKDVTFGMEGHDA